MPVKADLIGQTFGGLYVQAAAGRNKHYQALWSVRCVCGATTIKTTAALRSGLQRCSHACGVAASNKRRAKHAMWRSKEYSAWQAIKRRCLNPAHKCYARYGGRGITMHPAWVEDFAAFFQHIGPAPVTGRRVSVDRINNDKGYEPGNVRWATMKEQGNNRSTNARAWFRNDLRTLSEIADMTGEKYHRVWQRFKRGLTEEDLVRKHKVGRPPKSHRL